MHNEFDYLYFYLVKQKQINNINYFQVIKLHTIQQN